MLDTDIAVSPQPAPMGDGQCVADFVIDCMKQRSLDGKAKYGTVLKTSNGRDPLIDAFQESLDLCMYIAQEILERAEVNGRLDKMMRRIESEIERGQ